MRISTYYSNIATAIGAIALMFGLAAVPAQNAAAVNTSEVDIQAEVYGNSVVFQVNTSRDLLSLNVRVVGPNRYLFEERIELFGTLEWIPNLDLADGNYSWEVWVVTANPGVTMRDLPAGTSPEITIEHFYDFEVTQTHISSGEFLIHDGALEMPAERRTEEEATRVRRVASAILNFLVPSAQAQAFTDDVSITKNTPRILFNSNLGGSTNWDVGYNEFVGWYVRDLTPNNFNFIIRPGAPSNALVISDNGNIGINTGTPNNRLDVVGGSVLLDNHLTVRNPSSSSVTSLNLNANNNNTVSASSWRLINDASNGSRFEIREGSGTQRLTILQGGNVGIGTNTPSGKLHVQDAGGFQISLTTSAASTQHRLDSFGGQLAIGRVGSSNQFVIRNDAPPNSLTIHDDGNIGVGTSAPAFPVHIQRANNTARVTVEDTGASASFDNMFHLRNNGNPQFRMENTATNRVWNFRTQDFDECSEANTCFVINKRNGPRFRFMQDGDMFIEGAYEQSSSRTVKSEVNSLEPDDLLHKLREISVYEWSYDHNPDTRHIGPMAEDFYSAFGLGSGEKSISPANLAGVSLAAVQALNQKIETLHTLNIKFETENAELQSRIERLEMLLDNHQ